MLTHLSFELPAGVSIGACVAVLALLAWVTLAGRDLWPFSHYPMFASYRAAPHVRVYRMRFVMPDGATRGCPQVAAEVQAEFGRAFGRLHRAGGPAQAALLGALVDRQRTLAVNLEPRLAAAVRVEVWERTVSLPDAGRAGLTERRVHVAGVPG